MKLVYKEYDDFFVFSKGFGIRTHQVSDGQKGFVEYLSEKLSKPLWVVHRLDKDTSGLILFAKSKTSAQKLSELFENQQIKKKYIFRCNKRKHNLAEKFTVKSHIEKIDSTYINNLQKPDNSVTEFSFINAIGQDEIWEARPYTGKPHQIRLHAQKAGIPILGDSEHSGSSFFRLALHSQCLDFTLDGQSYSFTDPLPPTFKLEAPNIFEECYTKRTSLFSFTNKECFRLVHNEIPFIRADIYGDVVWVYDYHENKMSVEMLKDLTHFCSSYNYKLVVRHMLNRGVGVSGKAEQTIDKDSSLENWTAVENQIQYQLKTQTGFSAGLFLDQQANRQWVLQNSEQKNVLNLFSYTSGFSVCAAKGGALQVTSVDVSQNFLNWSKENFKLNQLNSDHFEFYKQDSLVFLNGSVKRNRKWDLIICDPPSFGRSKDGVWSLEKNLGELATLLVKCLNKNGNILFTCNIEKKSLPEIIKLFCKNLDSKTYKILPMPMIHLDYETTDSLSNSMKGFILEFKA